jgi:N-methylhydantoinase A
MEEGARTELRGEGVSETAVQFKRWVDLKYGYQISELTLPLPLDASTADLRSALTRLFTEAHHREFGYSREDPIELVSIRLRATATATRLRFADLMHSHAQNGHGGSPTLTRQAYFGPRYGLLTTPIRERVDIDKPINGPLIVEEPDTTVVVPPQWQIHRDGLGNLILSARDRKIEQ